MTVESFLQKQQDTYEALFYLVEAIRNDRTPAVQHMMAQAEAVLKSWETSKEEVNNFLTSHGRKDKQ